MDFVLDDLGESFVYKFILTTREPFCANRLVRVNKIDQPWAHHSGWRNVESEPSVMYPVYTSSILLDIHTGLGVVCAPIEKFGTGGALCHGTAFLE